MAMTETASSLPVWSLGDRLRKAREHAGFSRDELADKLGVAKNTLWNWESGATRPKELVETAERWSQATGVPAAWLLGLSKMYSYTPSPLGVIAWTPEEPEQTSFDFEARRPSLSALASAD